MKYYIAVLAFAAFIFCAVPANAQTFSSTIIKRPDYTLKARAYVDPSKTRAYLDPSKRLSLFDLRLYQDYSKPYHWDFVIPNSYFPRTQAIASVSPSDYGNHKRTTIHATLRQSSSYTEKVTFKDLNLAPPKQDFPFWRTLSLNEKRSITTPSGITVTLPAQSYDVVPAGFAGPATMSLFVRVEVTPNTKLIASLPNSPLFRKHHLPVSLRLGVTRHAYGQDYVSYYKDATPPYKGVSLDIPNIKTTMHLDELTFYIRQRIDLQTVPVAIEVPVSRPALPQKPK